MPIQRQRFFALFLSSLMLWLPLRLPAQAPPELFAPYQDLLERHLLVHPVASGGLITAFDYDAAMDDDRTAPLLQQQSDRLAAFDPDDLDQREQALAFWINSYNFFMLEHILSQAQDDKLVDSVKDFGSLFNPYRVFSRSLFTVGGKEYSLDAMEKDILLGDAFRQRGWWDARVHFAVNCASVGCPPLRQTIYQAHQIDTQLDDSTRRALATPRHLRIDNDTLHLSRLFDWYEQDFIDQSGSVRAFVQNHLDADRLTALDATSDIEYIDYDWRLNQPGHFPERLDR